MEETEEDSKDSENSKNMSLLAFCKMCNPYEREYQDIFGYAPCNWDYVCSQEEYFTALIESIETKKELSALLPTREYDYPLPKVKR